MKCMRLIVFTAFLGLGSYAQASYFIITPQAGSTLNTSLRTHLVIAGQGNDLGHLPQWAASAKVKKIAEASPRDQILFISTSRTGDRKDFFQKMGYSNIRFVNKALTPETLVQEIVPYTQIASMHFYGHGAIPEGVFLDTVGSKDVRWYPSETAHASKLIGHFTEDAFVTLNGCNGAHVLAPRWSKLWKVPVAGAMVGTHFEALATDGRYYTADRALESQRAQETLTNQGSKVSCQGQCLRMRPSNGNYRGHYGSYRHGLPFYKFFCVDQSIERCESAMARSILTNVSTVPIHQNSSYGEYAASVREWLCPSGSVGSTKQIDCIKALMSIDMVRTTQTTFDRTFSPFGGVTSKCNMQGCYSKPACLTPSNTLTCAKNETPPARGESTTFVDEYMHYLRGYQYLKEGSGSL